MRGNLFKLSNVGVGSKACRGLLPLVGRPRLCIFTAGENYVRKCGKWEMWEIMKKTKAMEIHRGKIVSEINDIMNNKLKQES